MKKKSHFNWWMIFVVLITLMCYTFFVMGGQTLGILIAHFLRLFLQDGLTITEWIVVVVAPLAASAILGAILGYCFTSIPRQLMIRTDNYSFPFLRTCTYLGIVASAIFGLILIFSGEGYEIMGFDLNEVVQLNAGKLFVVFWLVTLLIQVVVMILMTKFIDLPPFCSECRKYEDYLEIGYYSLNFKFDFPKTFDKDTVKYIKEIISTSKLNKTKKVPEDGKNGPSQLQITLYYCENHKENNNISFFMENYKAEKKDGEMRTVTTFESNFYEFIQIDYFNDLFDLMKPIYNEVVKEKSKTPALLLSIFLGMLGADRIYLGYIGLGVLKFFTLGAYGFWWLIDIVLIATNRLPSKQGRKLKR